MVRTGVLGVIIFILSLVFVVDFIVMKEYLRTHYCYIATTIFLKFILKISVIISASASLSVQNIRKKKLFCVEKQDF